MFATDRRSYQQDWEDQPGRGVNNPIQDPLRNTQFKNFLPDPRNQAGLGIVVGRVVESLPYLNTCKVNLGARGILQCSYGTHASNNPWGVSDSLSYAPGQQVLVFLPYSAQHGVIVCAVPDAVSEPNDWRPDAAFSGYNVGFYLSQTSNFWMGGDENEMIDFSTGRPYDATQAGERISQSSTGLGTIHDDSMIAMKVDEVTGVFGFYDDSMLRITGRNLQIWGHGNETNWLNDEGELNGYSGSTPYPWEAMGAYAPGVETSLFILDPALDFTVPEEAPPEEAPPEEVPPEEDPPEDGEAESANEATSEEEKSAASSGQFNRELEGIKSGFIQPLTWDQQPFHRVVSYSGYLGQGGRKMIITPGEKVKDNPDLVTTFNEDIPWLTMASQQMSLAGSIVNCTSGGFFVVQRPPQVTPKRKELAESPLGDNSAFTWRYSKNYDACGMAKIEDIDLVTHFVVGDIPVEAEQDGGVPTTAGPETISAPDEIKRMAAIDDEIHYMLNWEALHPYAYHEKDFFLPEESELTEFEEYESPPYEDLGQYQYMGQQGDNSYPKKVKIKVDHRYGTVDIYLNTSFFGLRKDGSFVMRSGCGCEIKTENGSMKLVAPGDISLMPGRNLAMMAGHDTILKARNSIDISSTETDIRLSADKNIMVASAVGGKGVMLFQSFSECVLDEKYENTIYPAEEENPDDPLPPIDEPGVDPEEPIGDKLVVAAANDGGDFPIEDPLPDPDPNPNPDPNPDPEPDGPAGPTFNLGEDVVGSGIVFKARRSQITTTSAIATIKVGQKLYREESGDGEEGDGFEPVEVDPETGELEEREWTWKPGKFRIIAEMGQIDTFSSHIVHFITPKNDFGTDEPAVSEDDETGAIYQVFLKAKEPTTEEDNPEELVVQDLPPNVLAAAGEADLSTINTCTEEDEDLAETINCYEVVSVNEIQQKRFTICGSLNVNKELTVGGCVYIRGKSFFFEEAAGNFAFKSANGQMGAQRADAVAAFNEADTRCFQLLPPIMAEQARMALRDPTGEWLDFSYRTEEQYGTQEEYFIMENWWQHQVRVINSGEMGDNESFPGLPSGLTYWQEKPMEVLYANVEKVAVYPGADYIKDEEKEEEEPEEIKNCYGVFELFLTDTENWRALDRATSADPESEDSLTVYEDPKLKPGKKWRLSHTVAVDVLNPEDMAQ